MRKIIIFIVFIFIFSLVLIFCMINNDKKYLDGLRKEIIDNTDIVIVNYINRYDNNYIVKDNDYLYLINNDYEILFKLELYLICDSENDYEIIYMDNEFIYLNEIRKDNSLVYEYYDIYDCKLIDRVLVGG